jgi:hypothetical protein
LLLAGPEGYSSASLRRSIPSRQSIITSFSSIQLFEAIFETYFHILLIDLVGIVRIHQIDAAFTDLCDESQPSAILL